MSARELKVINPYTGEPCIVLPMLDAEDIDSVVAHAREAFAHWRWTSIAERKALCERFMTAFAAMGEETARKITMQMGKPLRQAQNEVNAMLDRAAFPLQCQSYAVRDPAWH